MGDEALVVKEKMKEEWILDHEIGEGGCGCEKIDDMGGTVIIKMNIEEVIVIVLGNDGVEEGVGGKEGKGGGVITDPAVGARDGEGGIEVLGDPKWGLGVGCCAKGDGKGNEVGGGEEGSAIIIE